MASRSKPGKALTEYETRQVEKIAVWKAEFPNPFGELFRLAAHPIAKVISTVTPDRVALLAIDAAYMAADSLATRSDIKVQAGVDDLAELQHRPMEVCDSLSRRVGTIAQGVATVEGALTGAGGVWTTLLDVPLLLGLCLRTIIKNGHCYGYALDHPKDKAWVLGAFEIALSDSMERRAELMTRLRELEHVFVAQTEEQVVLEELASLITQIEIFEDIPVFGAVTGALLNLATLHKTDVTARHLFQERWLRDNGKIETIKTAAVSKRIPSGAGWSGALGRAYYATNYGLGFAAALPVFLALAVLAPVTRPITSRLRKGRSRLPALDADGQESGRGRSSRKRLGHAAG
jgi:hypothetical protein